MNYWLDLFTGTTWKEFRDAGSKVTGFRKTQLISSKNVNQGDIFLCYLTGVMRWVGALEVIRPSSDRTEIWKDADFPVRFEVNPLVVLDPEHGVPMSEFEGRLTFYTGQADRGKFKGMVRRSPNRFQAHSDGEIILEFLRRAQQDPIARPVDCQGTRIVTRLVNPNCYEA